MDDDTISRQTAIDAVMDEFKRVPTTAIRAKTRLESLPAAQPDLSSYSDKLWRAAYERGKAEAQPQRMRGRWSGPFCSKCGISKYNFVKILHTDDGPCGKWNYCPNCGARMDGGEQG